MKRSLAVLLAVCCLAVFFAGCSRSGVDAADKACILSIECGTILDNISDFNSDKLELLPPDGIILARTTVSFSEGESVYDVLVRETRKREIHMESSYTPGYGSAYIEGIANIYEFDCGALSGWTYFVNGVVPNYGCSSYILKDGDEISWRYTCDMGRDTGAVLDGDGTDE